MAEHKLGDGPALDAQNVDMQPALDAAGQSLSAALRTSFKILTGIIVVLALVFLGKGFSSVPANESVLVLRLGKAKDVYTSKGLYFAFPYPIDEIVRIPITSRTLEINTFWPKTTEQARVDAATTGGELKQKIAKDAEGAFMITGDLNTLQARWTVLYQVESKPDSVIKYFRKIHSIGTDRERNRSNPDDLSRREPEERLLRSALQSAILSTVSRMPVDIYPGGKNLKEEVDQALRRMVQELDCGIAVTQVTLEELAPPADVKPFFDAVLAARTSSTTRITDANRNSDRMLIEAAGEVGIDLAKAIDEWWQAREARDAARIKAAEAERSRLFKLAQAGEVYGVLAEANTYRTRTVQEAKSDADQVRQLDELRKRSPKDLALFLEHVRIEAVQEVLANCYEKYVFRPEQGDTKKLLEIWLNRRADITAEDRKIRETR